MTLDDIDRRILTLLQEDARISNADLAREVGLSPSPCLRRLRELEASGVIRRHVSLLDHGSPDDRTADRRACLKALERKVLWLSSWMIHNANHVRPNRDGLKVGGHQAGPLETAHKLRRPRQQSAANSPNPPSSNSIP